MGRQCNEFGELEDDAEVRALPVVVWWSDVAWVSALVDHDLVSQGRTPSEAVASITEAAHMMVSWSIKDGKGPWDDLSRLDDSPRSIDAMAQFRARHARAVDIVPDDSASKEASYKAVIEVDSRG